MYGSPYKDYMKDNSWKMVHHMGKNMLLPEIILGDLNLSFHPDEKRGGKPADGTESRKFNTDFNNIGLHDL